MNRTLMRARIALALILVVGIFGLVVLLLLRPPTLTPDAKVLLETAIGQLVLLLAFAIHAIFAPGAQVPESTSFPNSQGPAAPKAN